MLRRFEHTFESVSRSERLVRLLVDLVDAPAQMVRPRRFHGRITRGVHAERAAVGSADLEGVRAGGVVLEALQSCLR